MFTRDVAFSPSFAGMHISQPSDPNWYLDSGATNQMTNDALLIIVDIAAITLPPGVSIPLDILSFTNITFSTLPLHSRQPLPLIWFVFQFSQGQICLMGPPTSHIDTGPMPHTEPNSPLTRHAHVESPTTVAILTPSSHASPFNPPTTHPSTCTSPVHTQSKSSIFKPKFRSNFSVRYPIPSAYISLVDSDLEPTCYSQAS
ncbi:unnamed protein product [Prunus brigantina]